MVLVEVLGPGFFCWTTGAFFGGLFMGAGPISVIWNYAEFAALII